MPTLFAELNQDPENFIILLREDENFCVMDTWWGHMYYDAQRESLDINIPDPHMEWGAILLITSGHIDVGFLLTFEGKDFSH